MIELSPARPLRMNIFSIPAHLPVVRGAVEKMCQLVGFDEDACGAIILSVDEAMTNIIRHAYGGADDKPIEIELAALPEAGRKGIRICLRDWGRCVDRAKIKSRDLDDVRPGGLGVHIMQKCMDEVEYEPAEGGGTRLTMTKSVPTEKAGP